MSTLRLMLLLALGSLTGCGEVVVFGHTVREGHASSVSSTAPASTVPAPVSQADSKPVAQLSVVSSSQALKIKSVTLALSSPAEHEAATDSRFKRDALLDAIKDELRSRKVFDEADSSATVVEVSIDDFAVQPTTNAIVFGRIFSNGALVGMVRSRDAQGTALQNFKIDAQARLAIDANGEDPNPLAPLYRRFAVLMADSVTGTVSKPNAATDQIPR